MSDEERSTKHEQGAIVDGQGQKRKAILLSVEYKAKRERV